MLKSEILDTFIFREQEIYLKEFHSEKEVDL